MTLIFMESFLKNLVTKFEFSNFERKESLEPMSNHIEMDNFLNLFLRRRVQRSIKLENIEIKIYFKIFFVDF